MFWIGVGLHTEEAPPLKRNFDNDAVTQRKNVMYLVRITDKCQISEPYFQYRYIVNCLSISLSLL
jgi:hypothetical protein